MFAGKEKKWGCAQRQHHGVDLLLIILSSRHISQLSVLLCSCQSTCFLRHLFFSSFTLITLHFTPFHSPETMHLCDHQIPKSHRPSSPVEALQVPEIVLSIQECLPLDTLLVSLRVSRLWYNAGYPLLWRTVHWENTRQKCSETTAIQEQMLLHSHQIQTLHCMFHSQGKISSVDTSVLLNSFVGTPTLATRDQGRVRVSTVCLLLWIKST